MLQCAVPIPLTGQRDWERFLERRGDLTARMELSVCDGCDDCGGRCVDGFGVTRPEWDSVREYVSARPHEETERVRVQKKTQPWPGAEDSGAEVTYCRFRDLERGECSIYPVRPTICRLFGHTEWLPCPIGAVTQVPEDGPEVWREYLRLERKTWAQWEEEDTAAVNEGKRPAAALP
jgi:Fe-S-cluster containining protein